MSVKIRKSLVATAFAATFAFAAGSVNADPLNDLHKAEAKIHKEAEKSQERINNIYNEAQDMLAEYRGLVDEFETNKQYNDHVAKLVAAQQKEIDSYDRQINEIVNTKRNVVPLMYKMIDTLEAFINADVPILLEERLARVAKLRKTMVDPNVTTSERYRQVLEAYQIEKDYGTMIRSWEGQLEANGGELTVDFVHVGRVAYLAQSKDLKHAWMWNNNTKSWNELDGDYLRAVTQTIRVARKQSAPALVKLPVIASE